MHRNSKNLEWLTSRRQICRIHRPLGGVVMVKVEAILEMLLEMAQILSQTHWAGSAIGR